MALLESGEAASLIRKATKADVPRIMQIRAEARENRLRDSSRITVAD